MHSASFIIIVFFFVFFLCLSWCRFCHELKSQCLSGQHVFSCSRNMLLEPAWTLEVLGVIAQFVFALAGPFLLLYINLVARHPGTKIYNVMAWRHHFRKATLTFWTVWKESKLPGNNETSYKAMQNTVPKTLLPQLGNINALVSIRGSGEGVHSC